MLHWDAMIQTLPIMGTGMLGIFVTTLVIVGVVMLLNKLMNGK